MFAKICYDVNMTTVLVIDAQGGKLGKQLVSEIRKNMPELHILAVGTNSAATASMLKGGADEAATGENAVVVASRRADIIVGPIGICIADSMLGEITPKMAEAVGGSSAMRVLIPFNNCYTHVVGVRETGLGRLVLEAASKVAELAGTGKDCL